MTMKKCFAYISFTFLVFLFVLSCKKDNSSDTNEQDNQSPVGASANAFLSDKLYDEMTLEILYMPSVKPSENSVENLNNFLSTYLRKPSGINIIIKEITPNSQSEYSIDNLNSIESSYREEFNEDNKIAASLIFVDGHYASNNQVLGVAYKNTSMAIFGKTVSENSGGLSQPTKTKLESTIMNHEMGHLLGLVNLGTPMVENHEDTEHGKHCENEECLMYYAAETTEIASFLIGNNIPNLDQNCKDDLIANGGK